jgi:hypothetical protein
MPDKATLIEAPDVTNTFYQTTKAHVTAADLMARQEVENFVTKHHATKIT